jgi:hypothetical protein
LKRTVNDKREAKPSVEVSSQPLLDELVAIKERLNAIETIESISNADVVTKYVDAHLDNERKKEIMRECAQPRSRAYLTQQLNFKSVQALDFHLKPLRDDDLLHQEIADDGTLTFQWNNLFRRLPKSRIREILGDGK